MLGKIPAARLALIEKIVVQAMKSVPHQRQLLTRDFLGAFFRGVAEEDLRTHRPADLAAAALAHLEVGRRRAGNAVCVDLAPPRGDVQRPGERVRHRDAVTRSWAPSGRATST